MFSRAYLLRELQYQVVARDGVRCYYCNTRTHCAIAVTTALMPPCVSSTHARRLRKKLEQGQLVLFVLLLTLAVQPASAAPMHGVAATHTKLERVARIRHMDATGVLFASPLAPLGTRLCVSSRQVSRPICGKVVDIPQAQHRAWQIETGRIIEVQPAIARLLCVDPTGLPSQCPVVVSVEVGK